MKETWSPVSNNIKDVGTEGFQFHCYPQFTFKTKLHLEEECNTVYNV